MRIKPKRTGMYAQINLFDSVPDERGNLFAETVALAAEEAGKRQEAASQESPQNDGVGQPSQKQYRFTTRDVAADRSKPQSPIHDYYIAEMDMSEETFAKFSHVTAEYADGWGIREEKAGQYKDGKGIFTFASAARRDDFVRNAEDSLNNSKGAGYYSVNVNGNRFNISMSDGKVSGENGAVYKAKDVIKVYGGKWNKDEEAWYLEDDEQRKQLIKNFHGRYHFGEPAENVGIRGAASPQLASPPQSAAAVPAVSSPRRQRQTAERKIEDFGEKIGGARKDAYSEYSALLGLVSSDEMEKVPLSKSWPVPNYAKLLESGMDSWKVDAIRALRDGVSPKPTSYWLTKRWSRIASVYRDLAVRILEDDAITQEELLAAVDYANPVDTASEENERVAYEMQASTKLMNRMMLYGEFGHSKSLAAFRLTFSSIKDKYFLRELHGKYRYVNLAEGKTKEDAIASYREQLSKNQQNNGDENPEKRSKGSPYFSVYRRGNEPHCFIGAKVGKAVLEVQGPFDKGMEAMQYLEEHRGELEAKLKSLRDIPSEREAENAPRIGTMRREGDVTPEQFLNTFGFRGVEFGNWVENSTRQADLNRAYDALMDLSTVTNLPPRAISLNGTLGLAFGARGSGGKHAACAHYEPAKTVINLTKKSGAGSLAHEWFHALDNYFAREDGRSMGAMMTEDGFVRGGVRGDVITAFRSVSGSLRKSTVKKRSGELDNRRTKAYWTRPEELAARSFEVYVKGKLEENGIRNDYLVNIRSKEAWEEASKECPGAGECYPYPMPEEMEKYGIAEAYDNIFQTVKTRVNGNDVSLYSASRPDLDRMLAESAPADPSTITMEQAAMMAFSEDVLGIRMGFIDGPMELHGQYNAETDTIYVNREAETTLEWTFWHEAFHAMRKSDPELYSDILQYVEREAMFTQEQMDAYKAAVRQPNMPDGTVREEMLADAFADRQTGRRVLQEIAAKDRTLAQRVISFTKQLAEQARRFFRPDKDAEKSFPAAAITDEQFERFSKGIEETVQGIRDSRGVPIRDTKGIRIISAPAVANSPYRYQPERQREFDIRAARQLLEKFSPDAVESAIRKQSGQKDSQYAESVLREAVAYAR